MKKTLVLAVDRDDDFGVKARVVSPVIGIDGCLEAAIQLGVADPEDSDVNGLLAAIQTFKELNDDHKDAEIALITGNRKVGHRSDTAVIDQLEDVLERVKPDRVILVGDGAEDEYVYPIISSRVPIDSVRKVYVKQAPGLEGTFYIISKMLKDPDKKKRFLVPPGLLFLLLGLIFFAEGVYAYFVTGNGGYIYGQMWPVLSAIFGFILLMYGFNIMDKFINGLGDITKNIKKGDITITFSILSFLMVCTGIALGIYAVLNIQTSDTIFLFYEFVSNAMWPIILSVVFREFGKVLKNYISLKKVNRSFMVGTIAVIGVGFIAQGTLDILGNLMGFDNLLNLLILLEFIIGIFFAVMASILQSTFNRYFRSMEAVTDEV